MKPYMTTEEIISVPRLSQPALSDDGAFLAWVESTTDWDKNEYKKHVHVLDAETETGGSQRPRILNPIHPLGPPKTNWRF